MHQPILASLVASLWTKLCKNPVQRIQAAYEEAHRKEPAVDQELLELTYSQTWRRPTEPRWIVNGRVNIGRFRDGGDIPWHWGTAHAHGYGTSVIGNELQSILKDSAATHGVELKFEYDPNPSLFDKDDTPSGILFRYIAGPKVGRAFRFAPVDGDEDGWSEMVAYAEQLLTSHALERICRQESSMAA